MKLAIERYPYTGATGVVAEQETSYGWVEVLNTSTIGTFPNYTIEYEISPVSSSSSYRYKWETSAGDTTWSTIYALLEIPTDQQTEAIKQAVIQKATRFLVGAEAPLGTWGELSEFGVASVRPDYMVQELLYGLMLREWELDLATLVTTDDVIRQGLQTAPADFPADRLPDVTRAIEAAVSWVAHYLQDGIGVA